VLNISKIQSESNSQQREVLQFLEKGCAQYIKDTIWKQFTTCWGCETPCNRLCSIYQRYNLKAIHNRQGAIPTTIPAVLNISKIQSESNSQHNDLTYDNAKSCAQYIKDTIWKQFTTRRKTHIVSQRLCSIYQRYNLKAIHNLVTRALNETLLCSIYQRYNLKAIHNINCVSDIFPGAVLNISKIQSESNSQL